MQQESATQRKTANSSASKAWQISSFTTLQSNQLDNPEPVDLATLREVRRFCTCFALKCVFGHHFPKESARRVRFDGSDLSQPIYFISKSPSSPISPGVKLTAGDWSNLLSFVRFLLSGIDDGFFGPPGSRHQKLDSIDRASDTSRKYQKPLNSAVSFGRVE